MEGGIVELLGVAPGQGIPQVPLVLPTPPPALHEALTCYVPEPAVQTLEPKEVKAKIKC